MPCPSKNVSTDPHDHSTNQSPFENGSERARRYTPCSLQISQRCESNDSSSGSTPYHTFTTIWGVTGTHPFYDSNVVPRIETFVEIGLSRMDVTIPCVVLPSVMWPRLVVLLRRTYDRHSFTRTWRGRRRYYLKNVWNQTGSTCVQ